jgi:hypothetical protein
MVAEAPGASSAQHSPTPPLSPWLQLMLAEIARKRAEREHERAEAARRVLERAAEQPDTHTANAAASAHDAARAGPDAVLHMSPPQRGN